MFSGQPTSALDVKDQTMVKVTRQDLVNGLRRLGLAAGDRVIVHSALSAFGDVEGGADTVIDALLEVLGEDGTLLMPAMPGGGGPFNVRTSPSRVGAITEAFRKRRGVLRSRHPSHSVCAMGRDAKWFVADHHQAPTAYNEGTPYRRTLDLGKILLLGCDQDRNTSLHTLECMANAPYLRTITREYVDEGGRVKEMTVKQMAGPHRDFIGLDRRFREEGVMTVGKIGDAVCRLMDGPGVLRIGGAAFQRDPAVVLCDNPYCLDCRRQRGAIKAHRLSGEDFKLSAVSDEVSQDLEEALEVVGHEGARAVELRQVGGTDVHLLSNGEIGEIGALLRERSFVASAISSTSTHPDLAAMVMAAGRLKAPAVVVRAQSLSEDAVVLARESGVRILLENWGQPADEVLAHLSGGVLEACQLAFNPVGFVVAGQKPFLQAYRTGLKRYIGQLYLADGLWDGTARLCAQGNGEAKELVSILRCRSFTGYLTLKHGLGPGRDKFREAGDAFWRMLDTM